MSLPDCLSAYIGKWITPPRIKAFNTRAQKYKLVKMNESENYLEIKFESGTVLRLHYWRFNKVIDVLTKAGERYVQVGSKIYSESTDTIEGILRREALLMVYPYANLRTAPFVCDLIVLCGIAQYGYTVNPRTLRKVQGVRKTGSLN